MTQDSAKDKPPQEGAAGAGSPAQAAPADREDAHDGDDGADPYGLRTASVIARREASLARRTFGSDAARAAFIERWNAAHIKKRKKAHKALERARLDAEQTMAAVPPVAAPARMQSRHRGLWLAFVVLVIAPVGLAVYYLFAHAQDQYASTTAFTVRSDETSSATELLGGLSQIVGGGSGAGGNADVLFEFIQSQEIVQRINSQIDLYGHYGATWDSDPVFSLWPGATIEDLLWFWKRMARITYDKGTGLLMVELRARDAATAQAIAALVVAESEAMINTLNATARRDSMANAEAELAEALDRLRDAREALAVFRGRTQILDPLADIQGRMGVLNNLQQQLAEALVEFDLLAQTTETGDPRVRQLQRRVEVIRDRIAQERLSFAAQNVTVDNTDYPALLARYEELQVDQEFAEQTYRAALTAMDAARSNAQRQSLYLATYIRPTLAERAEYPRRLMLIALTGFFALTGWGIGALVFYSLRDRG